jgi:hypothetical protein
LPKALDPGLEHIEKMRVANRLQWMSALEAKYSVITLLSHTKSMMNNIVGSSSYEVMYSGLRNFRNAWNRERLATINPEWKDDKKMMRDVAQLGGIEGFFRGDLSIIGEAQRPKVRAFAKDLIEVMKKNPEMKNFSPSDLAKRHGVSEFFLPSAHGR